MRWFVLPQNNGILMKTSCFSSLLSAPHLARGLRPKPPINGTFKSGCQKFRIVGIIWTSTAFVCDKNKKIVEVNRKNVWRSVPRRNREQFAPWICRRVSKCPKTCANFTKEKRHMSNQTLPYFIEKFRFVFTKQWIYLLVREFLEIPCLCCARNYLETFEGINTTALLYIRVNKFIREIWQTLMWLSSLLRNKGKECGICKMDDSL